MELKTNPAIYLDNILESISTEGFKYYTFNSAMIKVYKSNFVLKAIVDKMESKEDNPIIRVQIFSELQHNDFEGALEFLEEEKLIRVDWDNKKVSITSKGFLKIQTKGFKKTIMFEKWNNRLQRATWIIVPIVALITLGIQIFNFVNEIKDKDPIYKVELISKSHKQHTK